MRWTLGLLATSILLSSARADDWPQWRGPSRDGVWRETGLIESFPAAGPTVRWRTPIGAGYSGPAVVGDRVYVADRVLGDGVKNPANAFSRSKIPGVERVLCLDDATGKILWKYEYDCPYSISYPSGPRTTPLVAGGKVYTLGAMGHLVCLDAASGNLIWKRDFVKEYDAPVAMWGFSAHPLIDGDRLITLVGGDGSVAVAFHKDTGKELWRALSAFSIGYAPPMIAEVGKTRQLIIWDAEAVHGMESETGKIHWTVPFRMTNPAMSIATPVLEGDRLFLTSFYNSAMMLRLDGEKPAASVVWQGKHKGEKPNQTDALHCVMATPTFVGDHVYGPCSYGEFRCIQAADGKRIWATMAATRARKDGKMVPENPAPVENDRWGNAFVVRQGERHVLFNEQGDLILAKLSPAGYEELGRANILKPDNKMARHPVVWSHPAFAHGNVYARNDGEIVSVSLKR